MFEFFLFVGQALTVSVVIVVMVMALAVFFKWLPQLGFQRSSHIHSPKAMFQEGRIYDVVLSSGLRLKALQFEGVVQSDAEAGWSVHQFAQMRRADGGKVFVRMDCVRVFDEVPTVPVES